MEFGGHELELGRNDQVADNLAMAAGIARLTARQFIWRSGELKRMLRMPVVVVAAGLAYLAIELWGGFRWVAGDWLVVAELGLAAVTGTAMGHVTRFRTLSERLQYRLTGIGLVPWAAFVAIRVGNFALARALGANLADATGLILLSFGVNRLAAIMVVRRRAKMLLVPSTAVSMPHDSR